MYKDKKLLMKKISENDAPKKHGVNNGENILNMEIKPSTKENSTISNTNYTSDRRSFIGKGIGVAAGISEILTSGISMSTATSGQAVVMPGIRTVRKVFSPDSRHPTPENNLITDIIDHCGMVNLMGRWSRCEVIYTSQSSNSSSEFGTTTDYTGTVQIHLRMADPEIPPIWWYDFSFSTFLANGQTQPELVIPTMYFSRRRASFRAPALDIVKSTTSPNSFRRELLNQYPGANIYENIQLPATWVALMNLFRLNAMSSRAAGRFNGDTTPLGRVTRVVQGGWYLGMQIVTYNVEMYLIPVLWDGNTFTLAIDQFGALLFDPDAPEPPNLQWRTIGEVQNFQAQPFTEFLAFNVFYGTFMETFQAAFFTGTVEEFGMVNNAMNGAEKYIPTVEAAISTAAAGLTTWATVQDNNAGKTQNILVLALTFTAVFGVTFVAITRYPGLNRGRVTLQMLLTSAKMMGKIVRGVTLISDTTSTLLFGEQYSLTRFNWWSPRLPAPPVHAFDRFPQ